MIQPGLTGGNGKTVLLVDDELSLLKVMSLYLRRLGYAIRTAATAELALAELQQSARDLAAVVLDASMPGLSTEDLASSLVRDNPAMCVVMASGYPVDMTVLDAAAPGRVVFLHKPFTPEMLAVTLRRIIGSQEEDV